MGRGGFHTPEPTQLLCDVPLFTGLSCGLHEHASVLFCVFFSHVRSFSILETKHGYKKLTTHVTVTLEVLINKSIKNIYCYFPLRQRLFMFFPRTLQWPNKCRIPPCYQFFNPCHVVAACERGQKWRHTTLRRLFSILFQLQTVHQLHHHYPCIVRAQRAETTSGDEICNQSCHDSWVWTSNRKGYIDAPRRYEKCHISRFVWKTRAQFLKAG